MIPRPKNSKRIRIMFVSRLVQRYSNYLDAKPFQSRCVTGAVLCFTGDILTQLAIEKKSIFKAISKAFGGEQAKTQDVGASQDHFDFVRSGRAFFVGATVISFNLYGWYSKLLPAILRRFQHTYFLKNYQTFSITFMGRGIFLYGWVGFGVWGYFFNFFVNKERFKTR